MPFFLKLSFVRPHQPLDPPEYYYNMYLNELNNIKKPEYGEWAKKLGLLEEVEKVDSLTGTLAENDYKKMIAGYYGLVTHIDHQINRFLISLKEHEQLKKVLFYLQAIMGISWGNMDYFEKVFHIKDQFIFR